jgi:outer membrane lipoprotein carrier protein
MSKAGKRVSLMLLLISHLSLSASSSFFTRNALAARQGEVDVLIKRIETRYGRMQGLAAEFEQTYSATGSGGVRRESGRLFLARPRRMRWEYPGKLFIVNGRDVWFYVPADREATHADAGSVSDERFPFLFLLGQTNLRRAFSSISIVEDSNVETNARLLRLVPRNGGAGVREVILAVTADGQILRVKLFDRNGAVSEIALRNVRENYVAPAESFQFTPPAGVNVRRQK